MSHTLWTRPFAADPRIIGRPMRIDNEPITVVGVMPEGFDFGATLTPGVRVDFFLPADLTARDGVRMRGNTLAIVGRLKPGATVASAEIDEPMPRLRAINSGRKWNDAESARLVSLKACVNGSMQQSLVVLWAAAPPPRR